MNNLSKKFCILNKIRLDNVHILEKSLLLSLEGYLYEETTK
jgi:hypothetical protein